MKNGLLIGLGMMAVSGVAGAAPVTFGGMSLDALRAQDKSSFHTAVAGGELTVAEVAGRRYVVIAGREAALAQLSILASESNDPELRKTVDRLLANRANESDRGGDPFAKVYESQYLGPVVACGFAGFDLTGHFWVTATYEAVQASFRQLMAAGPAAPQRANLVSLSRIVHNGVNYDVSQAINGTRTTQGVVLDQTYLEMSHASYPGTKTQSAWGYAEVPSCSSNPNAWLFWVEPSWQ